MCTLSLSIRFSFLFPILYFFSILSLSFSFFFFYFLFVFFCNAHLSPSLSLSFAVFLFPLSVLMSVSASLLSSPLQQLAHTFAHSISFLIRYSSQVLATRQLVMSRRWRPMHQLFLGMAKALLALLALASFPYLSLPSFLMR